MNTIDFLKHTKNKLKNEELYYIEIKVKTGSMQPLINVNEIVRFAISKFRPQLGDAILFIQGDHLVCHRIVDIVGENYITKGDDCIKHDIQSTKLESILGYPVFLKKHKKIINLINKFGAKLYSNIPIWILYRLNTNNPKEKYIRTTHLTKCVLDSCNKLSIIVQKVCETNENNDSSSIQNRE